MGVQRGQQESSKCVGCSNASRRSCLWPATWSGPFVRRSIHQCVNHAGKINVWPSADAMDLQAGSAAAAAAAQRDDIYSTTDLRLDIWISLPICRLVSSRLSNPNALSASVSILGAFLIFRLVSRRAFDCNLPRLVRTAAPSYLASALIWEISCKLHSQYKMRQGGSSASIHQSTVAAGYFASQILRAMVPWWVVNVWASRFDHLIAE